MTNKITTVFFDYGGTLCDYYPSNAEIWAKIAEKLGVHISADDSRIRQGMRKQSQAFERLGIPDAQLSKAQIHTLNCHVLTAMGIDGEGTQTTIDAEFFAREQGLMYTMYPDAPQTLDAIKREGLKIGLLSNVGRRGALTRRPSLKENGILHYFDTIILSAEVGVWKPNKEIFNIALREIGEKIPANAMHVGDSPIADVKGARNAGLIPVFFDPLELYSTENVIKIKALSDILQYIK